MNRKLTDFIPIIKEEMDARGWDCLDILFISGDAYVDHPSFGVSLLARFLEKKGFRVGIIPQPIFPGKLIREHVNGKKIFADNKHAISDFKRLGTPRLFVAVGSGAVDSMINNYTANKKKRSTDIYSPLFEGKTRPDDATIVYSKLCKEAFPETPVIIGGIEASLRRLAHYDYWKNKLLPSIVFRSFCDVLVYGMGENQCLEIAEIISKLKRKSFSTHTEFEKEFFNHIEGIKGIAYKCRDKDLSKFEKRLVLPSYNEIKKNKLKLAKTSLMLENKISSCTDKAIIQGYNNENLIITPPSKRLSQSELDFLYELPYTRKQHYSYFENALKIFKDPKKAAEACKIPALEIVKYSITIHRGCFGGCSFCGLGYHQGKIIQSRSLNSIIREIELISKQEDFTGYISDLGGPTANMYEMNCTLKDSKTDCLRPSCLVPNVCKNLDVNHNKLTQLMIKVKSLKFVKKVVIASGVRYDLALKDKRYLKELISNFVGGHLKTAPENIDDEVLKLMNKPSFEVFLKFKNEFEKISTEAKKEQYIVPYFISNFPGCTNSEMEKIRSWLQKEKMSLKQVQSFIPLPMTLAASMYFTEINPYTGKKIYVSKSSNEKISQQVILQPRRKKFIKKKHELKN